MTSKIYVVGGDYLVASMFVSEGYTLATNLNEARLVCFTGGADVSPSLYGEEQLPETHCVPVRDKIEQDIFSKCANKLIPMVGICRGGQFLNVMNGGKMWQHVNNHNRSHWVFDDDEGDGVMCTSTHHQMMIPAINAEGGIIPRVVGTAAEATLKKSATTTINIEKNSYDDIEVLHYPATDCLCFQPHPEYESIATRRWFFSLLKRYALLPTE